MRKIVLLSLALLLTLSAGAKDREVKTFRYAGPFAVQRPVFVDEKDVNGKAYDAASLLSIPVDLRQASRGTTVTAIPAGDKTQALHLLAFGLEATGDTKVAVHVTGLKQAKLFLDGTAIYDGAKTALTAGSHEVTVKYLTGTKDAVKKPRVTFDADDDASVSLRTATTRSLTLHDIMDGRRPSTATLSPSGRYLITAYYTTAVGGKTTWTWRLTDLKTRRTLHEGSQLIYWMPTSDTYYYIDKGDHGNRLTTVDPATGTTTLLAEGFPDGDVTVAPSLDWLLITEQTEIPRKDKDVLSITEPDDRQPTWRQRATLVRYDIRTGVAQPLTFGYHPLYATDISRDGRYLLYTVSHSRLTERPTTLSSIYRLDMQTLDTLCLVRDDGFIAEAQFSPDGTQIAVKGSPEALGGIGRNLPEGMIPSMYDYQLYTIDIATGKAKALTRTFDPSIENFAWSAADGMIYATALDRDYVHLYRLDPATGAITQLPVKEDVVARFALADHAPLLAYTGEGATNSYRVYTLDTRSAQSTLVDDCSATLLKDVEVATCEPFNILSHRGDTVYARYYLPYNFDPAKRYPMIVTYYGGCSPTSRNFEGSYPPQLYCSLGYVTLVVNPSGAAGFGQEYAARHVNTAGDFVADDIIEATRAFCRSHAFVDSTKIGCIGASYGGFMTQYLQTKTDLFAAAISHAGISDHTSYWGGGYWGYTYSEVSMAKSYPWTRPDLYVGHSPLYNVDKIHTPILFLHGTADNNVPTLESIQMFNALKLLGRETALILVKGEDHWVLDYQKRIRWQNAINAWFQKWLKGDSKWWEEIYK